MSKYYTPEIEEFHVGFEYEMLEMGSKTKYNPTTLDKWDDLTGDYDSSTLLYEIARGRQLVRVKHLDREDIGSLSEGETSRGLFILKDSEFDYERIVCMLTESNFVLIGNDSKGDKYDQLFVGKIKNKSELKKLLKQLGI
jgi:hypothetical protein